MDCVWGSFGEWTDCSAECGTGTQSRTRTKATEAEYGGAACIGGATEAQECNTHHCPGTYRTVSYDKTYPAAVEHLQW